MTAFADRLTRAIREHGPLCVGIDPSGALLKSSGLPDSADGALEFGKRVLAAGEGKLSIVKPQSAFFERFGSAGVRALEELSQLARANGVLVLLDGKRGDIDTTGAAYAESFFGPHTSMQVDAVTTHAYLGIAALDPFFDITVRAGGGAFVVVRSSNPEGRELQLARLANGMTVADHLTAEIEARNRKYGASPYGPIGAVVGATCEDAAEIAAAMPSAFILAPGVGAQGATMHDVAVRMPQARGRVLPNVSRAILANGATIDAMRTTIRALQEQARELA